jgi:hypothetical protein
VAVQYKSPPRIVMSHEVNFGRGEPLLERRAGDVAVVLTRPDLSPVDRRVRRPGVVAQVTMNTPPFFSALLAAATISAPFGVCSSTSQHTTASNPLPTHVDASATTSTPGPGVVSTPTYSAPLNSGRTDPLTLREPNSTTFLPVQFRAAAST